MPRPFRQVLRLSPLEQRIRDRRADLFWVLDDAAKLANPELLGGPEDAGTTVKLHELCDRAEQLAAGLVELVKQRDSVPCDHCSGTGFILSDIVQSGQLTCSECKGARVKQREGGGG